MSTWTVCTNHLQQQLAMNSACRTRSSLRRLNQRVTLAMIRTWSAALQHHVPFHRLAGRIILDSRPSLQARYAPSALRRPLFTVNTAWSAQSAVIVSMLSRQLHVTDGSTPTTSTQDTMTRTGRSCFALVVATTQALTMLVGCLATCDALWASMRMGRPSSTKITGVRPPKLSSQR